MHVHVTLDIVQKPSRSLSPEKTRSWKNGRRTKNGSITPLRGLPEVDFVRKHRVHPEKKDVGRHPDEALALLRPARDSGCLVLYKRNRNWVSPASESSGFCTSAPKQVGTRLERNPGPQPERIQGRRKVSTTLIPDLHSIFNREAHITHGWVAI